MHQLYFTHFHFFLPYTKMICFLILCLLCFVSFSSGSIELLAGRYHVKGHNDDWCTSALFDCPSGIAIDDFQNVFVADRANHCIRVVLPHGTSVSGINTE
jgi:hypothetical protein